MPRKRTINELQPVKDQRLISFLESITPRYKWKSDEKKFFVTGSQRFGLKQNIHSDIDFIMNRQFMMDNFGDILEDLATIRGSNDDPGKQIWEAASYKVKVPFSETEYNLIIADEEEVYEKWKYTTEAICTLCDMSPLTKKIISTKQHRIWLFRQFLRLWERYTENDLSL